MKRKYKTFTAWCNGMAGCDPKDLTVHEFICFYFEYLTGHQLTKKYNL